MKPLYAILLASTVLTGCASRTANPVAVSQPTDQYMSCPAIDAEIARNQQMAQQVAQESANDQGRNIVIGTVGLLLFWPALFALDLGDAEEQELAALQARNAVLAQMRGNCTQVAATPRPVYVVPRSDVSSPTPIVQPTYIAPPVVASPPPAQTAQTWVNPDPSTDDAYTGGASASSDACANSWAAELRVTERTVIGIFYLNGRPFTVNGSPTQALAIREGDQTVSGPRVVMLILDNVSDEIITGTYLTEATNTTQPCKASITLRR